MFTKYSEYKLFHQLLPGEVFSVAIHTNKDLFSVGLITLLIDYCFLLFIHTRK